jgi:hypothetical protein
MNDSVSTARAMQLQSLVELVSLGGFAVFDGSSQDDRRGGY